MRCVFAGLLILLTLSPLSSTAKDDAAPPFFGKVVAVTAANSLVIKPQGAPPRQVVLAFLSIPMADQPYATRARQVLEAQLLNRSVSVRTIGEVTPDYTVGVVYVGSENFNMDFLKRGHAWIDYYQITHPAWMAAQRSAKEGARGLYADPDAIHPLDWKAEMIKANAAVNAANEMGSDQEFVRYLETTYVGNREEKIFVPTNCIQRWAKWPRVTLVAFLSVAGAEDNGYRLEGCG